VNQYAKPVVHLGSFLVVLISSFLIRRLYWNQTYGITLCDFDNDGDLDVVYSFFYYQVDDEAVTPIDLSTLQPFKYN
jgi:hypothetical protein